MTSEKRTEQRWSSAPEAVARAGHGKEKNTEGRKGRTDGQGRVGHIAFINPSLRGQDRKKQQVFFSTLPPEYHVRHLSQNALASRGSACGGWSSVTCPARRLWRRRWLRSTGAGGCTPECGRRGGELDWGPNGRRARASVRVGWAGGIDRHRTRVRVERRAVAHDRLAQERFRLRCVLHICQRSRIRG